MRKELPGWFTGFGPRDLVVHSCAHLFIKHYLCEKLKKGPRYESHSPFSGSLWSERIERHASIKSVYSLVRIITGSQWCGGSRNGDFSPWQWQGEWAHAGQGSEEKEDHYIDAGEMSEDTPVRNVHANSVTKAQHYNTARCLWPRCRELRKPDGGGRAED